MNNKITEMKNTLTEINSRITEAEGWVNDLEDRTVEITVTEENKEKKKRSEVSLRDLWDSIKWTNVLTIGFLEEDRGKGPEKIFEEIIVENFTNMRTKIFTQAQEVERISGMINMRRNMSTHIKNKLTKIKDKKKVLKTTQEK